VSVNGVTSMKEAGQGPPPPLPDLAALHQSLMENEKYGDVLDYVLAERGLSVDVLTRFKLGASEVDGIIYLVMPYMDAAGQFVFYKARSVPPAKKAFRSAPGRPTPLFNVACLKAGMEELFMVEGEIDSLTMITHGVENVVGAPGAGMKKLDWLQVLDTVAPKNIYLIYDNDKAGQQGAKELAKRIGLDKVKNIVLPTFEVEPGIPGKDINDWFKAGRSMVELMALKETAKHFDIDGVQDVGEILVQLSEDIEGKGTEPKYKTPWASLTKRVGGFEDGDLVGIMAEGKVGKTTMALNWLQYYACEGIPTFLYCQEMQPKRMVRKWVSMVTQTDDTPGKSEITVNVVKMATEYAKTMAADILFGYTASSRPEDVMETIRQVVRRYGVKVVCFDNLQLLVRNVEHSAAETSKITKMFKEVAMELGIVILLIVQPHRVPDGQIISARNAMGSSSIEKDVDYMICLHRNRVQIIKKADDFKGFMESEENFEPYLLVRVDLGRYAPGGMCTLYMDGATSTVREVTEADMTQPSSAPVGQIQAVAV
jgi:twinkle protein